MKPRFRIVWVYWKAWHGAKPANFELLPMNKEASNLFVHLISTPLGYKLYKP